MLKLSLEEANELSNQIMDVVDAWLDTNDMDIETIAADMAIILMSMVKTLPGVEVMVKEIAANPLPTLKKTDLN